MHQSLENALLEDELFVIGAGVVGQATASLLRFVGGDPALIDIDVDRVQRHRAAGWRADSSPTAQKPTVTAFMCVPTPVGDLGIHSLEAVRAAIQSLMVVPGIERLTIVLRSTVTPGACASLFSDLFTENPQQGGATLVYMPEFLRQDHAEQDALSPRAIVLASRDQTTLQRLAFMFAPFQDRLILFDSFGEGEMIKIAHNAWNAVKISFWNEMYRIGQRQSLDMAAVARTVSITAEASWNPAYGISGGRPFGGACLPKDLMAFIAHAQELDIEPRILLAAHQVNAAENQLVTERT